MFNSYEYSTSNSNNLKINAVSGNLVKNHAKSRFIVCKSDSSVFDPKQPRIWIKRLGKDYCDPYDVVVLQAMIIGEGLFLCEVVLLGDFA